MLVPVVGHTEPGYKFNQDKSKWFGSALITIDHLGGAPWGLVLSYLALDNDWNSSG